MVAWRRFDYLRMRRDCYLAYVPKMGRGVIKKIDSAWFFIQKKDDIVTKLPMFNIKEAFYLFEYNPSQIVRIK